MDITVFDHQRMNKLIALGIVAITALAGCGGDDGPTCGTVAPCGGNIVGEWTIQETCVKGQLETDFCPTATSDLSGLALSGTVSYRADGTYSAAVTSSGSLKLSLPEACLATSVPGVTLDCAEIAREAQDPDFQSVTCAAAGKGCTCTFVMISMPNTETGTYVTAGNLVTHTHDGSADPVPYCVKGSELHIVEMDMGGMGQMTISSNIVLKKK
jgi:hypothetical protein